MTRRAREPPTSTDKGAPRVINLGRGTSCPIRSRPATPLPRSARPTDARTRSRRCVSARRCIDAGSGSGRTNDPSRRRPSSARCGLLTSKVAVFIDGCFWHGCSEHGTVPATNQDYWMPKLAANQARDRRNDTALIQRMGRREGLGTHRHRSRRRADPVTDRRAPPAPQDLLIGSSEARSTTVRFESWRRTCARVVPLRSTHVTTVTDSERPPIPHSAGHEHARGRGGDIWLTRRSQRGPTSSRRESPPVTRWTGSWRSTVNGCSRREVGECLEGSSSE